MFFAKIPMLAAVLACWSLEGAGRDYDVRSYGAKGDGAAKDTAALQKALDDCARTGGRVVVPPGTYLTGSLFVGDNTQLHLEKGSAILGSPDLADYNAPDAYPQNWGSKTEGWSAKHLILVIEKKNVSITGEGVIDGNGRAFFAEKPSPGSYGRVCWRNGGINAKGKKDEQRRPGQTIVFVESENLAVRDVTLKDMTCWSCFFHGCENVTVGGVTIRNGIRNLNTDGIDIDSCRNVRVGDCDIVTGDDAVTVRGSPHRLRNKARICENVWISNIVCRVSADGVRVGVGNGTIRNVHVSDVEIKGAGRGLHVQCCYSSKPGEGRIGVDISNVAFKRVKIRDAFQPVCVVAGSGFSNAHLRNISFEDIDAESYSSAIVAGNGKTRADNVSFGRCAFRIVRHGNPFAPDRETGTLLGSADGAFRIERTDGISFENCSLRWNGDVVPSFGSAFSLFDTTGLRVDGASSFVNRN